MKRSTRFIIEQNGASPALLSPNQTNHLQLAAVLHHDEAAAPEPAISAGADVCKTVDMPRCVDRRYPSVLYNPSILARLDVLQAEKPPDEEVGVREKSLKCRVF